MGASPSAGVELSGQPSRRGYQEDKKPSLRRAGSQTLHPFVLGRHFIAGLEWIADIATGMDVDMAELHKTAASLRFFGDDLDPEEITRRLGGTPSVGVKKGGIWLTPNGTEILAHTGQWRLKVERRSPGNLDGQVAEIFVPLTTNLAVWNDLSNRFRGNVFCGLFLDEFNEGISLSPGTLTAIGSRGLTLDMDIYGRDVEL